MVVPLLPCPFAHLLKMVEIAHAIRALAFVSFRYSRAGFTLPTEVSCREAGTEVFWRAGLFTIPFPARGPSGCCSEGAAAAGARFKAAANGGRLGRPVAQGPGGRFIPYGASLIQERQVPPGMRVLPE